MNLLQQVKDKLEEEKVYYHSMLEIEREFYPDTFNERKKRIEKITKEVRQMRNRTDPYPTPL